MEIGRTIYYNLSTGSVILDTGERQGDVATTTEQQDFAVYPQLQGVDPATVGVLQLGFQEHATEYLTGYISNVDPTTKAVTFTPYA